MTENNRSAEENREALIKGEFKDQNRSPEEQLQITERIREGLRGVPEKSAAKDNEKESAFDFSKRLESSLRENFDVLKKLEPGSSLLNNYIDGMVNEVRRGYWTEKRKDVTQRTISNMAQNIHVPVEVRKVLVQVLDQLENEDAELMKRDIAA